jgi:cysteine-rich repeat protein
MVNNPKTIGIKPRKTLHYGLIVLALLAIGLWAAKYPSLLRASGTNYLQLDGPSIMYQKQGVTLRLTFPGVTNPNTALFNQCKQSVTITSTDTGSTSAKTWNNGGFDIAYTPSIAIGSYTIYASCANYGDSNDLSASVNIAGMTLSGPSNINLSESGSLSIQPPAGTTLFTPSFGPCFTDLLTPGKAFVSDNASDVFGTLGNSGVPFTPKIKTGTHKVYAQCTNYGVTNTINITALPAKLKLEENVPGSKYQVGYQYLFLLSCLNSSNAPIDCQFDTTSGNFAFSDGSNGAFEAGSAQDTKHLQIYYTPSTPSTPIGTKDKKLKVTYMNLPSNELDVTAVPPPPSKFNVACPSPTPAGKKVTCTATPVDSSGNSVSYQLPVSPVVTASQMAYQNATGINANNGNGNASSIFGDFAQNYPTSSDVTFSYTPALPGVNETVNFNVAMNLYLPTPTSASRYTIVSGNKAVSVTPLKMLTFSCDRPVVVNTPNNCTLSAWDSTAISQGTPTGNQFYILADHANPLSFTEEGLNVNVNFSNPIAISPDSDGYASSYSVVYTPTTTGQKTLDASFGSVGTAIQVTVYLVPSLAIAGPATMNLGQAKNYKVTMSLGGGSTPFEASSLTISEDGATSAYNPISNITPTSGAQSNVTFDYTPNKGGTKTLRAKYNKATDGTLAVNVLSCGNGIVETGETCDDHNTTSGDGCSADCKKVEAGFTCPASGGACTVRVFTFSPDVSNAWNLYLLDLQGADHSKYSPDQLAQLEEYDVVTTGDSAGKINFDDISAIWNNYISSQSNQ